jgi:glycerol-3-phosphate acyltransferase PlsY
MAARDLLILIAAYLLGSIPSAHIAAHVLTGKEIYSLGDGNMGAKNTFHSVGRIAGVLVAVVDVGKGALAITLARNLGATEGVIVLAGVCVVLGHDFPVFTRFRGGQGMAAIMGVFGVVFPVETLAAAAILLIVLLVTHNWDASCAVAFVFLVGIMVVTGQPPKRFVFPFVLLPTIGVRKFMQRRAARSATV